MKEVCLESEGRVLRPCCGPSCRFGVKRHSVSTIKAHGCGEGTWVCSELMMALGYSQRAKVSRDTGLLSTCVKEIDFKLRGQGEMYKPTVQSVLKLRGLTCLKVPVLFWGRCREGSVERMRKALLWGQPKGPGPVTMTMERAVKSLALLKGQSFLSVPHSSPEGSVFKMLLMHICLCWGWREWEEKGNQR